MRFAAPLIRAVTAALLLAGATRAGAQDILALTSTGDAHALDSATGTATLLGPSGFSFINSMAKAPDGTIYATSGFGAPNALLRVDPTTGVASLLAVTPLLSVRALACDDAGTIYAVEDTDATGSNVGLDDLYVLDPLTGASTRRGAIGYFGVQGLAWLNGRLLGWEIGDGAGVGAGLIEVDPLTGAGTDVNPALGNVGMIQSLCASPSGELYGLHGALYRLDPATGSSTQIGSSGLPDFRGCEFRAAAGFGLARTGSCPGLLALTTTGGTPGGVQAFVHGSVGSFTLGSGPCVGLQLPLATPVLAGLRTADAAGAVAIQFQAPPALCGRLVLVVDAATCRISNLVTL